MVVYKIANLVNGKVYIGQTTKSKLMVRWREHIYVSKNGRQRAWTDAVHCAIRKYGFEKFTIEPIHRARSRKELNAMETFFIVLHQSHKPENGYNMTLGGDGIVAPRSEQHKARIAAALLGMQASKETRKKISEAGVNRIVSLETRRKQSTSLKGWGTRRKSTEERQAEMRERQLRRKDRVRG